MDGERTYHKMGKTAQSVQYQTMGMRTYLTDYKSSLGSGPFPSLSDEFLNEYIPTNLDQPVTWRDILLYGMIPEHRQHQEGNNQFIRPDIHFDKIEMFLPEAPSPAPIPELGAESPVAPEAPGTPGTPEGAVAPEAREPSTHTIVHANEVVRNIISCTKNEEEESIEIILMNNETNEKYITTIKSSDKSWIEEYSKYFQDFNKFYDALNKTFTETNFYVKWSIKDKTREMVLVQISCVDDLFGFKIDIYIGREQNYIDKLENRVKVLEKTEVKYHILEKKVQSLIEIIDIIALSASPIYALTRNTLNQTIYDYGKQGSEAGEQWEQIKKDKNWLL